MNNKLILMTNNYDPEPLKIIRSAVPSGFELICPESSERKELLDKAHYADYFLVSGRQKIDRELIGKAVRLKMIQRTGVGTDMIDIGYTLEKGIPVYVNKGVNAHSVAEHTLLLMLASLRRLTSLDHELKSGIWKKQSNGIRTNELRHKTLGLIGMGKIGQEVAALLKPFNCRILYYDMVRLDAETENALAIEYSDINTLFIESRLISLHCPLTDDTRCIINKKSIALMRDDAVLINTARGGLVDQAALYDALANNKIGAAALDVYMDEPVTANEKLLTLENVITTPHIGGITKESFFEMMHKAMDNIRLFSEGKTELIEDKKLII